MKRIFDAQKNCLMAIDGEYEFEIEYCHKRIKYWRSLYCRKNSKKEVKFKLKSFCPGMESSFWKYYLELFIQDKKIESSRICEEAYKELSTGFESEQYGEVEFTTIEYFSLTSK